jgi:hypothetical protein
MPPGTVTTLRPPDDGHLSSAGRRADRPLSGDEGAIGPPGAGAEDVSMVRAATAAGTQHCVPPATAA